MTTKSRSRKQGNTETILMAKRNNKEDKEIERLAFRALVKLQNAVAGGLESQQSVHESWLWASRRVFADLRLLQ
jgi:hypothetical protein